MRSSRGTRLEIESSIGPDATGRIDGLVAAVMAVSAMTGAAEPAEPAYTLMFV